MGSDEYFGDIIEAIRRMQKLRIDRSVMGLNQGEHFFLHVLHSLIKASDTESVYVSAIGRELNISGPAVSKMLRNLESKQMIRRETDSSDRRNTFVSITDKGLRVKEKADTYLYGFFSRVFEKVGKEDMARLKSLLIRFCDAAVEVYNNINERKESINEC